MAKTEIRDPRQTLATILAERPDVVVLVADATALERNLYLLAELLALPAPVVLALNMIDVARERQVEIDIDTLRERLGVPVVAVQANRRPA